jgi:hypothetical protein
MAARDYEVAHWLLATDIRCSYVAAMIFAVVVDGLVADGFVAGGFQWGDATDVGDITAALPSCRVYLRSPSPAPTPARRGALARSGCGLDRTGFVMAAKKPASSAASTPGVPWTSPDSQVMPTPMAGTDLPALTEQGEKLSAAPGSQRAQGKGIH